MKEQSELKKPPYNCPSDGKCHYPKCGCQWYLGIPTLPVGVKTAEEIWDEMYIAHSVYTHDMIYKAMEAYHAQFKPIPTEDKGIKGVKEAAHRFFRRILD